MCRSFSTSHTAVRFEYADNGQTVTYALGEQWCNDDGLGCEELNSYKVTWARTFRYDGARQRYLDRELDPGQLASGSVFPDGDINTHYDGNEPFWSRSQETGQPAEDTGYSLGQARINDLGGTPSTDYYHTDMLGTTRFLTDESGTQIEPAAYTAFGELVSGSSDRFGYVGAHGYQTHAERSYPSAAVEIGLGCLPAKAG